MIDLRRHAAPVALAWDDEAPGARHRRIDGTLMFADISGFTALTERMKAKGRVGAEEIVDTLNRVFGGMLRLAHDRGGELLKFGGDALLFLFREDDHLGQACDAAVEMRAELTRATAVPTSVGRLRLSMSVGIHSGDIDLFLAGEPTRELFILGPAATATSAAEKAAEAGEIVLSESSAQRLPATATRTRADGVALLRRRRAVSQPRPVTATSPADPGRMASLFPHELGEHLAPGPPEPEHRSAAIAFVRFAGTDALLAEQGPEAVGEVLQEMVTVVERALATEGISLLATDLDADGAKFFLGSGLPRASEDDEGRMLRAMRRLLDIGTPLPVWIGVNRGHVFAAEIGIPARGAYTGMGDTTNTAARIMSKALPGQLLAHPAVVERSRTTFAVAPAGPFAMKGKALPLLVYAVGEELGTREAGHAEQLPFLGREEQLAEVRTALSHGLAGAGAAVTVTGATGAGKTRLAREAVAGSGAQLVAVRAEPYGASSAYRVFRDAVRRLLGVSRGTPVAMGAMLVAGLERIDPPLLPLAPLIADIAQVEVPDTEETRAIDPQFRADRVREAAVELLAAAVPGPMILVVEEAHWADAASTHLLEGIAAAVPGRPWGLLTIRRGDVAGGFTPAAGETVEVGPLPDDVIERLVHAATESTALRPHEIRAIAQKAAGNPMFVQEVARLARERGSLEVLPDSVQAALSTQIDLLSPHARRVLRCCAVLGRSFRRAVLTATLADDDAWVDDATWSDLAAFLEADGADRVRFRNSLVRDAAYEGLAYRTRTRLHASAGRATERLSADPASDAATLSLHFWRAGDLQATWKYARLAGDLARASYANADAAAQYERAVEASRRMAEVSDEDRAHTWSQIGTLRELNGMLPEAVDAYRRAAALTADPLARAGILVRRARVHERASAYPTALRDVGRARRLVGEASAAGAGEETIRRVVVQLDTLMALVKLGQERPADARRWAEQAIAGARETDDAETLVQALIAIDTADLWLGKAVGADHTREALAICMAHGFRPRESVARANLGAFAFYAGRWAEAVDWYRSSLAVALEAGNAFGAAETELNLGEILIHLGRIGEAEEAVRHGIRVLDVSGVVFAARYGEMLQARILLARGELARADELAATVAAAFTGLDAPASAFECALIRAEAAIAAGHPERGLLLIADAESAAKGEGSVLAPRVHLLRTRALLAAGQPEAAADEVAAGLAAAREQELPYEEALLLQQRSFVAAGRGGPAAIDSAAADAAEADRILVSLGAQGPAATGS